VIECVGGWGRDALRCSWKTPLFATPRECSIHDRFDCKRLVKVTVLEMYLANKMTAETVVYKEVYPELVRILPMDDVMFTAQLYQRDLLPGDRKAEMESKSTRANKATYFLDHVITPSLTNSFSTLLKVMEDSEYDAVKELAKLITTRLMEGVGTAQR